MKQTLPTTTMVSIVCFSFSPSTQEEGLVQSVCGMEKKAMAAELAELNSAQKDAFWIHYDEFESKRKELGRIEVLTKYVCSYHTLDDASTDGIIRYTISPQGHNQKLIFTYYNKIKIKKRSGVNAAAQFYLIENYILGRSTQR